ncbi:MAG: hypothetical protein ACKOWF_14165 [Chloroflexota bacterium]
MSEPRRSQPDDAPMLLPAARVALIVIVFLLFVLLGRIAGTWLDGGGPAAEPLPAPSPPPPALGTPESAARA